MNEMHEKYYTQRSSGGFLMTEATGISQHGLGWFKAPGKFVLLYVLGAHMILSLYISYQIVILTSYAHIISNMYA